MSYELLTSATPSKTNVFKEVNIGDGVTSDWFIFPPDVREVGVDFIPVTLGKIQTSNDIDGMVNGSAVGIDWDFGEVAGAVAKVAIGVRGFRVVSVSGAVKAIFNGILGE